MFRLPEDPETLYRLARENFQAREYSNCIRYLSRLAVHKDYKLKALVNTGACLYQIGHLRAAKKFLLRGIQLDPDDVSCQLNLAKTQLALKDYEEASVYFRQSLINRPKDESAWRGLLESSASLKEYEKCLSIAKDWSLALSDHEEPYFQQVLLLQKLNRSADAVKLLHECKRYISDQKRYDLLFLDLLRSMGMLEEALSYCKKAILNAPQELSLHTCKGLLEFELCRIRQSSASFQQAYSLSSHSVALFLNQYFLIPSIPSSSNEVRECRVRCYDGLSLAEKNDSLNMIVEHLLYPHTYSLVYHNQDDRQVKERYYQLMKRLSEPMLKRIKGVIQMEVLNSIDDKKIRIGFLSQYFHSSSTLFAFQGLIRSLDRAKFQVFLMHFKDTKQDDDHLSLCSVCDEVVYLTNDLPSDYTILHALRLDILYFTDLGMNSHDFLYPMFRAAPIQLTGWGVPHTSGIDDIDYYISAKDIEPYDAQTLYTEQLVTLPGGLPCCFRADMNEAPDIPKEYFFLPDYIPS